MRRPIGPTKKEERKKVTKKKKEKKRNRRRRPCCYAQTTVDFLKRLQGNVRRRIPKKKRPAAGTCKGRYRSLYDRPHRVIRCGRLGSFTKTKIKSNQIIMRQPSPLRSLFFPRLVQLHEPASQSYRLTVNDDQVLATSQSYVVTVNDNRFFFQSNLQWKRPWI